MGFVFAIVVGVGVEMRSPACPQNGRGGSSLQSAFRQAADDLALEGYERYQQRQDGLSADATS